MGKSRRNGKKPGHDTNSSKNEQVKVDTEENEQKQKNLLTACLDCGLNWTDRHVCRAFGKVCLKCGRSGHFARVCRFSVARETMKKDEVDAQKLRANKKNEVDNKKKNDEKENKKNDFNFTGPKLDNNNQESFKDKHVQKEQSEMNKKKTNAKDDLAMKEEANTLYKQKKFKLALAQYTRLIELCPTNENHFNNRSACYMMMGEYEKALLDAKKAVEVNPTYLKAHARLIKCALSLGNDLEAEAALQKLSEVDPKHPSLTSERKKITEFQNCRERASKEFSAKNYKKSLSEINKALLICDKSIPFKVHKGECLAHLGKYKEAEAIANAVLSIDKSNIEAKYILGLCIYQSDVEKALTFFKDILRLVPDHAKVVELYKRAKKMADKKREGNDAFLKNNWAKAYSLYEEAIKVDPDNLGMKMRLYYNMAQVSYKLGKLERSISECSKALAIDSQYVKALMRRGRCYMDLERWEDAVSDLTRACRIDNGKDCQKLLNEAKKHLVVCKRDYHKIIGVSKSASVSEIKKAYKEKAMLHHPDRHSDASEEEQKKHEKTFKEITQAYRILTKESAGPSRAQPNCGCGDCQGCDDDEGDLFFNPEFFAHIYRAFAEEIWRQQFNQHYQKQSKFRGFAFR